MAAKLCLTDEISKPKHSNFRHHYLKKKKNAVYLLMKSKMQLYDRKIQSRTQTV